ncbi:MAG TPA: pyrroline-5-carboxylate reductase [Nitrospirota bacterium]|nr:pyrroline-5-carboxylate reductase [Nitrospirota bacterium]
MAIDKKIAFLGGGNMAEALIKGLLAAGAAKADQIFVTDISSDRLEYLKKTYGIIIQKNNGETVEQSGIILLCVKPQVIDRVLEEIAPVADTSKLVISIAAGITIGRMERVLTGKPRVIRVMPNTPALVLAGAAGLAGGKNATGDDLALAQSIFNSVGRSFVVDEKLMDAVTGLSGSGPAYVFEIIDALSDAGVKAGLPRELALELAAQTVYGAAKMVLETKEQPGRLRDMVTSPGGTTIEGLHALEKGKLRATLMNAVEAATARSRELGK